MIAMDRKAETSLQQNTSLESNHPSCIRGIWNIFDFYQLFKVLSGKKRSKGNTAGGTRSSKIRHSIIAPDQELNIKHTRARHFLLNPGISRPKTIGSHRSSKKVNQTDKKNLIRNKLLKRRHKELQVQAQPSRLQRLDSIHHKERQDQELLLETGLANERTPEIDAKPDYAVTCLSCNNDLHDLSGQTASYCPRCQLFCVLNTGKTGCDNLEVRQLLEKQAKMLQSSSMNYVNDIISDAGDGDTHELDVKGVRNRYSSDEDSGYVLKDMCLKCVGLKPYEVNYNSLFECELNSRELDDHQKIEYFSEISESLSERGKPRSAQNALRGANAGVVSSDGEFTLFGGERMGANDMITRSVPDPPHLSRGRSFKYLKQKIWHAAKGAKKECRRITMDGILHRIPYGSRASHLKSATGGPTEDGLKSIAVTYLCEGLPHRQIKRSASLNESLEKYAQLFELTFQHGHKFLHSGTVKLSYSEHERFEQRKKLRNLLRVHSLPLITSYNLVNELETETGNDVSQVYLFTSPIDKTADRNHPEVQSAGLKDNASRKSPNIHGDGGQMSCIDADEQSLEWCFPSNLNEAGDVSEVQSDEIHVLVNRVGEFEFEFEYVRQVLKKYCLLDFESLHAWYKVGQPMDPYLADEFECSLGQLKSGRNPCDFVFLSDLIKEALLELYYQSYTRVLEFLICMSVTPDLFRYSVLKEVWTLISWTLSLQSEEDKPVEYLVECEINKNSWMNILLDIEDVELELEDWILDDLFEEFLTELVPWSS